MRVSDAMRSYVKSENAMRGLSKAEVQDPNN